MAYYYSCRYRQPGHATVPKGYTLHERGRMDLLLGTYWRRTDLPIGDTPYGLISYPAPLDEPERWDLKEVEDKP
ncbi:MAG TPA: hypothetical protein EYQ27_15160 [Gemmatimonadetes bacterium]|nr:hypothetical protein [Gemmatimonadota bacterium]